MHLLVKRDRPPILPRIYRWSGRKKMGFAVVVVLACLCGPGFCPMAAGGASTAVRVECEVHSGPCEADLAGAKVSLDIRPKPVQAMRNLAFTLTVEGKTLGARPYIDLGMDGMNMGRNRVTLRSVAENVFEGTGIIVRCPSGRRTWKAVVTAPAVGSVEFVFDVIY